VFSFPGGLRDFFKICLAVTGLLIIFPLPAPGSPADLAGRVVVLDPGHGGDDPGAVDAGFGLYEKCINLSVARRLQRLLMDAGARAVLTHNDTEVVEAYSGGLRPPHFSLGSRVALANQSGTDIFISLHTNSFHNSRRTGSEVFYCPGSVKGALLGTAVQKELAAVEGQGSCGLRPVSYYVLRRTRVPAIVVELGYLTSAEEAVRLLDPAYQETLARAIFSGIRSYFGEEARAVFKSAGGGDRAVRALVAIVIDDLAGPSEKNGTASFFAIGKPLTFAVMPNFSNSAPTAQRAVQAGYQVLVHLPMEPLHGDANSLGPGAIYVRLSEEEIRQRVHRAVASVPGAVGMNNHMGSRATADARVMRAVLAAVKEHGMFFVDSRTTEKTVIPQVAAELGVPYAVRGLFLDNVNSLGYIKGQLRKAGRRALERGSAIAIGHVGLMGPNTARAIREIIPEFEAQGIEMAYVSNVVFQHQPGVLGSQ